ncbi:MAG: FAD-dependent oxidoreductase [Limnochordia bacterium]|nr:FAD-dependent oxidoreductase [Limnochordia bacterium]
MDYDVIVVGGGTAGTCAAVAAAREGAKTLVVESAESMGGTSTRALICPVMENRVDGKWLNGGLHLVIQQRLKDNDWGRAHFYNPLGLSLILEDLCEEAGVEYLYRAHVTDVMIEGDRIVGVVVHTTSGRRTYRARTVIDATGDAQIAWLAKVPCNVGRPEDGKNQPMTLRFAMEGVDLEKVNTHGSQVEHVTIHDYKTDEYLALSIGPEYFSELIMRGEIQASEAHLQLFGVPGQPGKMIFNFPRCPGTTVCEESITQTRRKCNQSILRIVAALQKEFPGFENAYLAEIASFIGVRESRRIQGKYELTEEEVLGCKKFSDAICQSNYPVDIHNPTGPGVILRYLPGGEYHEVPYRCLLPQELKSLIVVGRCISASFNAQAAIRIVPNCRTMGEAAGIAAAWAAKDNIDISEVDGKTLSAELKRRGILSMP